MGSFLPCTLDALSFCFNVDSDYLKLSHSSWEVKYIGFRKYPPNHNPRTRALRQGDLRRTPLEQGSVIPEVRAGHGHLCTDSVGTAVAGGTAGLLVGITTR